MVSIRDFTTATQGNTHNADLHVEATTILNILNRVKKLNLTACIGMATISQVAEYYEVGHSLLRTCVSRHRRELEKDGIIIMRSGEFIALYNLTPKERSRGRVVIEDNEGNEFVLSVNKTMFLPARAILHIGMLLQASPVARKVCNQLLRASTDSVTPHQLQPTNGKEATPMASIQKLPVATAVVTTTASEDIITDHAMRDQMISRIEVLDKVKNLFLISYNDMATVSQVADYYEVSSNALRQCIMRNRDEVEEDGIALMNSGEFKQLYHITPKETTRGRMVFEDAIGSEFMLSPGKTMFLSKRAILRIGMLLRDSIIAREVRTQLLNGHEKTSDEQKSLDLDEEKMLACRISLADTVEERCIAVSEYREYINRHTTALRETIATLNAENDALNVENDALAYKEMMWTPRAIVEKLIRIYAARAFRECAYSYAVTTSWNRFFDELYYEFRISLASRRKRSGKRKVTLLNFAKDDEWPVLVAKSFAMCRRLGCNVEKSIGNDVVMQQIEQSVEAAAQYVPQPDIAHQG